MRFLYVMDPMCAWCYGFQPELEAFLAHHPGIDVDWVMGGLAPDTQTPMDERLQQTIASYWRQIEQVSQVTFNHAYWTSNTPFRSTYPACRAVIAAETLTAGSTQKMVKAIQSAYYREAKNPSLNQTLIGCAESLGFDPIEFSECLLSRKTELKLTQHLELSYRFQVSGFPALFYILENKETFALARGFCKAEELFARFSQIPG